MNVQEEAWRGDFGAEYAKRNQRGPDLAFWARVLSRAERIGSAFEFGAGTGANVAAIQALCPWAEVGGLELNELAYMELSKATQTAVCGSILTWEPRRQWDLTVTKGLLIHIAPSDLASVYEKLVRASSRYILVAEYFSPSPVSVEYRGRSSLLWKRDFAGEMLDRYPLRVVDYAFVWRRDAFPQDDVTWVLMEKK